MSLEETWNSKCLCEELKLSSSEKFQFEGEANSALELELATWTGKKRSFFLESLILAQNERW